MDIEKLAKQSHTKDKESGKLTLTLADPENSYTCGFGKGFLAGFDYAASLIKLQTETAPTLNRQEPNLKS